MIEQIIMYLLSIVAIIHITVWSWHKLSCKVGLHKIITVNDIEFYPLIFKLMSNKYCLRCHEYVEKK